MKKKFVSTDNKGKQSEWEWEETKEFNEALESYWNLVKLNKQSDES